jgi:Uncharacterized protein conserved in bacteria
MELREFAERVLFSSSLEEKLQTPDVITDSRPGPAIVTPTAPGRPRELIFKPSGSSRGEFPGTRHLEQNYERGRLLHFFANHELLATELMALVLLKFPDAPAAFRKGVFETLKDEQEHTRLYIERMKACGIEFGSIPVSGYFWRAVSGMESPMDYVAGLSLTFEQANLDFARHFSSCFAEVGDADSSKLLQKIYRDEIGHVAYGLKWFRRWKNPTESDWEAFCRQLKFPLSPARAKGFSINVEGRKAAGLPLDFIENLNVFSQSKGRTPTVFVFNPLAEARIAGGKGYSPNKHQAQLVRDLTALPMFLCRQDDIVIVEQKPTVHFLSGLKEAGFVIPEFVELNHTADLAHRKLGSLRPWAWSPDSFDLLRPLFPKLSEQKRSPEECFNPRVAELYSKAWSAAFLRKFLTDRKANAPTFAPWLCSIDDVGVTVRSMEDALAVIAKIRQRDHHKIILKESIGVAGSNALRLFEPEISDAQRRWMSNVFDSGQSLVIEPWLNRALDFSVQFDMSATGLRVRGYTGLLNDARGQFQANWAEPRYEKAFPGAVFRTLGLTPRQGKEVQQLFAELFTALEQELKSIGFVGPIGIDCFVYQTDSDAMKLKPIVEINPRYTMGRVTVELMRRVFQGSSGVFRLINRAALKADGFADFPSWVEQRMKQHPLKLDGSPNPRIREGFVALTDLKQSEAWLATFEVFRSPEALNEALK